MCALLLVYFDGKNSESLETIKLRTYLDFINRFNANKT